MSEIGFIECVSASLVRRVEGGRAIHKRAQAQLLYRFAAVLILVLVRRHERAHVLLKRFPLAIGIGVVLAPVILHGLLSVSE